MARIAINGFGRIGRLFFRQAFSSGGGSASGGGSPDLDIVAINDLGDLEDLAYLLAHDSVYRKYERTVESDKGKDILVVDMNAKVDEPKIDIQPPTSHHSTSGYKYTHTRPGRVSADQIRYKY